jgi:hypothetical protein
VSVRVTVDQRAVTNNVTYWEDTEQFTFNFQFDTQTGTGKILKYDSHTGRTYMVAVYPPHLLAEIVAIDED